MTSDDYAELLRLKKLGMTEVYAGENGTLFAKNKQGHLTPVRRGCLRKICWGEIDYMIGEYENEHERLRR